MVKHLPARKKIGVLLCLAAGMILVWGWSWLRSVDAATDNAYVRGDITSLAPRVGGYVTSIEVEDNQAVRAGDILFRIDDRDYRARLAQAQANVEAARARLANVHQEIRQQDALVHQAEAQRRAALADMDFARATSARRHALVDAGFVTRAQVDESDAGRQRAEAIVVATSATVSAQRRRIGVLGTQREAARAAVAQAEAALELARIDLDNTVVRSPVDGVVGNRQVRLGRLVAPGAPLLDVVPVAQLFVVANFKETQLRHIRPGQTAHVRIDSYPDARFEGEVDSFAPGSGSAFSLIPPDNATGNFVRVVQRVPVKIRLRRNPLLGRLVPGMSARVEIDQGN